jgi:hypothetical protein
MFSAITPSPPLGLAAAGAPDCFLLLQASLLTFAHVPPLAAHSAQDSALGDLFTKPLQQLLIGLAGSTHDLYQSRLTSSTTTPQKLAFI